MSDVLDVPPVRVPGLAGPIGEAWPEPEPPRTRLLLGALGSAVLAALVVPDVLPGINVVVVAFVVTGCVLAGARARGDGDPARRRGPGRAAVALTLVSVALSTVAVVRASEWLVAGCLLAAMTLGAAVALGSRRWNTVLATVPLIGLAVLRSLPWASATVLREHRRTRDRFVVPAPVLSGLVVGAGAATVIGALLASADADFAAVLSDVGGWLAVDVPASDVLVARLFTLGFVALTVLGLGFAASARLRPGRPQPRDARPPAAWLTPLVLVALTVAAFLAVEATRLFGGEAVLHETSTTHAARAREGFGQLIVVTVLVLLLVGWAGRAAAGQHRRAMAAGGGALLVLALLLAVSALRRLWLYQDHFGWTVARLNAGAFELWVVVVLLTVAAAWSLRRTDLLPRLVAGSAGLGLLVIALAGPDALVAAADVRRYEQGKGIDTVYLSTLSADAVPALVDLPEPVRVCALPGPPADQPWYAWNLSRARAGRLLATETLTACAAGRGADVR